jgi:SAM-dependent methyltransferase
MSESRTLGARLRRFARSARRGFGRLDRRLIGSYLADAAPRKLHLGCGLQPLPGWLNTDLEPPQRTVVALDVARPFPFADATFDHVYSQHLIEHLPYAAGQRKLAECLRVLRPGGRLRIATPDLRFLLALAGEQPSELELAYVRRATEIYFPGAGEPSPVFAINNFFRNWGHRFLYDEALLRRCLAGVGFVDVERRELGESGDPELRGLENEARLPPGFLRLETLVLEAGRPES